MARRRPGRITLILGGARSGKSWHAQRLAETRWRHPVCLATAEAKDREMRARIRCHREARPNHWRTIEEPLDIARVLARPPADSDGVLVDCVTLWLSNVLLEEGPRAIAGRSDALLRALEAAPCDVILVSNEVGLGIVPERRLGRVFRDEAGRLNQRLAAAPEMAAFFLRDGQRQGRLLEFELFVRSFCHRMFTIGRSVFAAAVEPARPRCSR